MMRKQMRTGIILIAVLIVCVVGYVVLCAWNRGAAERQSASATYVAELEEPISLSFTNTNGTFNFSKDSGVWSYTGDVDFPLDQRYITSLVDTLSGLEALRVIHSPDMPQAYGLDQPDYIVTAENELGDKATILVGNAVSDGYYATVQGETTVYTITSALVEQVNYKLNDLIKLETIPMVTEQSVKQVDYIGNGEALTLVKRTLEVSEPSDATGETSVSEASAAPSYQWESNGQVVPEGNTALMTLINKLAGMSFAHGYAYKADTETLSTCGLDAPLSFTVSYEDGSYTLEIGGQDENGYYYARLAGSKMINLLTDNTVQCITALTNENLMREAE